MIRKEIKFNLLLIIALAILFTSCDKEEKIYTAYGDAMIQSFYQGDSIVYGIYFFTYSGDKMKEVTVLEEGSTTEIVLDSAELRYSFSYIPDSTELTTTKPGKRSYTFHVVFDDGTQYTDTDVLDSVVMNPPVVKEYKYDQEDERFVLDWEVTDGAYQYRVLLENEDKELVFQSELFTSSQTYIWITSNSYGWAIDKQPDGGETYRAIVIAYRYEAIPSAFDLQSISYTTGDYFEWIFNNNE
jgi:hypothetical protein